jgi:hypothetical protein
LMDGWRLTAFEDGGLFVETGLPHTHKHRMAWDGNGVCIARAAWCAPRAWHGSHRHLWMDAWFFSRETDEHNDLTGTLQLGPSAASGLEPSSRLRYVC